MLFKAKIGDKQYQLDKMTFGDARLLKARFGVNDIEELNTGDPDVIVGLLVIAAKRERPMSPLDDLVAEIENADIAEFSYEADDEQVAEDPTPAGGEAAKSEAGS